MEPLVGRARHPTRHRKGRHVQPDHRADDGHCPLHGPHADADHAPEGVSVRRPDRNRKERLHRGGSHSCSANMGTGPLLHYSVTPLLRYSVTPSLRHSVTPLLTKLLFCVLLHYFLLRYSVSPVISVPLHLYRRTLLLAT